MNADTRTTQTGSGFATGIRRLYRRGLMTQVEMELALGLVTVDEVVKHYAEMRYRMKRRTPRAARVARRRVTAY